MQFTRFTDYALRVLIYVGQRPDEWVTIRKVSDAYGISRNHLMKVVSFLGNKGYLESQRGPGGGVRLRMPPAQVSVADVIFDAEGGMNLLTPPDELPDMLQHPHDTLDRILNDASDAFMHFLRDYNLADMLASRRNGDHPGTAMNPTR